MKLHCDTCARQQSFEQRECEAQSRAGWACTGCGDAIVVAPVILLMDRRARVLVKKAA